MYLAQSEGFLGSHAQAHVSTALLAVNLAPPCQRRCAIVLGCTSGGHVWGVHNSTLS